MRNSFYLVRCIDDEDQCQKWFAKFRSSNCNLADEPPNGPLEADVDKTKSLVDVNRRTTTREIAESFNLSNAIVQKHMKRLGLISKRDMWVPHVFTERNLLYRIKDCVTLIRRQRNDPFLKHIVTDNH